MKCMLVFVSCINGEIILLWHCAVTAFPCAVILPIFIRDYTTPTSGILNIAGEESKNASESAPNVGIYLWRKQEERFLLPKEVFPLHRSACCQSEFRTFIFKVRSSVN